MEKNQFFKTDHFLYRQWDRKIPDELVQHALKTVLPSKKRSCCIVSRKLVKKALNVDEELFIIFQSRRLITCYLGEISFGNSKHSVINNYIIISE